MTNATRTSNPAWHAELTWERRSIPMTNESPKGETEESPEGEAEVRFLKVRDCFVDVSRSGEERIRFRVNHRRGCSLTVTDPRDRLFGTAGTTGVWGTRPARAGAPEPFPDADRLPDGTGSVRRSGAGRRDRSDHPLFFLSLSMAFVRERFT